LQIGQVSFSSNSFVVCGTIVAGLEAGDVEAGAGGGNEEAHTGLAGLAPGVKKRNQHIDNRTEITFLKKNDSARARSCVNFSSAAFLASAD